MEDQLLATIETLRRDLETERRMHAELAASDAKTIANLALLLESVAIRLTRIRTRPWRWLAWRLELKIIVATIEQRLSQDRGEKPWRRLWSAVMRGREVGPC